MARRTLGDGLTPEMEAFLNGKPTKPKAKTETKQQKEKPPMRQTALKKETLVAPVMEVLTPAPMPVQTGMVGLNTRVEPAISAALLRASVDRKIQRKARAAVQDIVNEALTEWLTKAGYLK